LILIVAVIIVVVKFIISKGSFKKDIYNKIETMDSELKEIRRLLEEKKCKVLLSSGYGFSVSPEKHMILVYYQKNYNKEVGY